MSELHEGPVIAGTGHRPNKILIGTRNAYDPTVFERLVGLAATVIHVENPVIVISGMALGWDFALAEAALQHGVPLHAYIPFVGQESKWQPDSQRRYQEILQLAEHVEICSPGGYSIEKMQIRNQRMVDDCEKICALWNGTPGGTANCIEYARAQHCPIRNSWSSWTKYAHMVHQHN